MSEIYNDEGGPEGSEETQLLPDAGQDGAQAEGPAEAQQVEAGGDGWLQAQTKMLHSDSNVQNSPQRAVPGNERSQANARGHQHTMDQRVIRDMNSSILQAAEI